MLSGRENNIDCCYSTNHNLRETIYTYKQNTTIKLIIERICAATVADQKHSSRFGPGQYNKLNLHTTCFNHSK
jgi:hypothetical protein